MSVNPIVQMTVPQSRWWHRKLGLSNITGVQIAPVFNFTDCDAEAVKAGVDAFDAAVKDWIILMKENQ